MSHAASEMGTQQNLTVAIAAVAPTRTDRQVMEHPFNREFTIFPIPEQDARPCLCGKATAPAPTLSTCGVVDTQKGRFRILGLLWMREGGAWRLVAYRIFAA